LPQLSVAQTVFDCNIYRSLSALRKAENFMATSNYTKLEPEHLEAIKALAEEIDCPVEKVNMTYASALESLSSNARIQDYLIVLASKKVRDALRH
jgi:hypothetical protein